MAETTTSSSTATPPPPRPPATFCLNVHSQIVLATPEQAEAWLRAHRATIGIRQPDWQALTTLKLLCPEAAEVRIIASPAVASILAIVERKLISRFREDLRRNDGR